MVLNVDVYSFDGGSDPRASWRHNASSFEEAFSLFSEDARKVSFVKLTLLIEGKLHGLAYRSGDRVEVITSNEQMIDF